MISTCPKCCTSYADPELAFCFADGTPLVEVEPGGEQWSEGARLIQENSKAGGKQRRRRWWRRIALGGVTTVLLAMVFTKSFSVETTAPPPPPLQYPSLPQGLLLPAEPASEAASPLPSPSDFPSPSPSPSLSTLSPSPARPDDSSPSPSPSSTPSPSPSPSPFLLPSPTSTPPVVFYKISGRVISASGPIGGVRVRLEGSKLTATTTDTNGYYTFSQLRAGGSYTIAPVAQMSFSPTSRSFNDLRRDESADFVALVKPREETQIPTPKTECSDSDKERIAANLISSFAAQWRRKIEQERSRIIAATFGVEVQSAVATLGPIEFQSTFTKCSAAVVTARYTWQVKADLPQGVKTVTVPGVKRFACGKVFGPWICN